FEDVVLLTVVEKLLYRERSSPADTCLIEVMNLENAYSICILVRERIKQAVVNDAEDDGRCANAKSEGKDGDQCEAAVFAKAAEGVSEISDDVVDMRFKAGITDFFFYTF